MDHHYDVIVIGSGPGGYVAAIRCSQLGLKTICVERCGKNSTPVLGGTCLNVGCIPSKALLDSSRYYSLAHSGSKSHGIYFKDISIDVLEMQERKDKIVSGLTNGVAGLFKLNKVESILGEASIEEPEKVTIKRPNDPKLILSAKNIIIATGSRPIELPFVHSDDKRIVTSTGALKFETIPNSLGVIGAGAIGLELGSVWSRLGSDVVVLEALEDFLPNADKQISSEAFRILSKQGLDIKLGSKVKSVKSSSKEVTLKYSDKTGNHEIKVDKLIVAVGRRPEVGTILGAQLGIVVNEEGFIEVNKTCETNIEGIYAIGDVVRGPMLAHKASEEGIMVAENISGEEAELDYDRIPSVIYTHPEVAWAGLTEEESASKGLQINIGSFPFQASGRALAANETEGFVKIITNAKDDSILGIHVIGPSATDIVQQGIIAMQLESSAEDLGLMMFSHPSYSEALHEAALASRGNAIHIGNRKR